MKIRQDVNVMFAWKVAIIKKVSLALAALILLFMLNAKSSISGESLHDDVFRVGVVARAFGDINPNDAAAALKAWAATVTKEQGIASRYEVMLVSASDEDMREKIKEKKIDGISCTVEDMMALGLRADYLYLPSSQQGYAVRYAIIAHREGVVHNWVDLSQNSLIIGGKEQMLLAEPWLKTMLVKNANQPPSELKLPEFVGSASKAILQVFFRQTDATIVTMSAFETACELNPQLRQKLKILYTSQPYIHSVFIFLTQKGAGGNIKKIDNWEKAILDLHNTPGGQQVLTVFKCSHMEKQPYSILNSTIGFFKEYHHLMGKKKPMEMQP